MSPLRSLARAKGGNAAVEMALVTPLILVLMFATAELGNYFMNEHTLVKAVRDGARFAARHPFTSFSTCDATPTGTVEAEAKNVTATGEVTGGTVRIPRWTEATFTVTTRCSAGPVATPYAGIYNGMASGARYVEVTADVPYRTLVGSIGFPTPSLRIVATQQAAVAGV